MRCSGASIGVPPTQMRWCCRACRTAWSPEGAVCTSLHPRQGGVRRHPPRRARGCNLPRLRTRCSVLSAPAGWAWCAVATAPPQAGSVGDRHRLMRPEEGADVAHRQRDLVRRVLPRVQAHLRVRRQMHGLHRDGVRVRRHVVGQHQDRRLALRARNRGSPCTQSRRGHRRTYWSGRSRPSPS